jgi:hypothetical protein
MTKPPDVTPAMPIDPLEESWDDAYELKVVNKKTGQIVQTVQGETGPTFSLLGMPLKIKTADKKEWEEIVRPLRNFTPQQLSNFKNIVNDLGPSVQKTVLIDAIQKITEQSSNRETFAFPSHAVMFTLLAMFAGKPDKIPRKLLVKPQIEWTPQEKKEADEFLDSILKKETKTSYRSGKEEIEEKYVAVVSDNPRVEANAEITMSFFREELRFREESLALYIKRTFGPEGLRHLLGLLIGLEENFRKGYFEWSVNEHLERLGYKRKAHGSFDQELKQSASEVIKVFSSLFITARKKDGPREIIQGEKLFTIEGFKKEIFDKAVIDERIRLRATEFWYKNAFDPKGGHSGKYTKLLKKIAQENHREHHLTIYLVPLLAIFWRMKPEQKISVCNLMDWCDLDHKGRYKLRNLKSLESELIYMIEHGYLGAWTSDGNKELLSESENPFDLLLTLTPPKWLDQELQIIHANKELPPLEYQEESLITIEEFQKIFEKSALSIRQFGNRVGLSSSIIGYLLKGQRRITPGISSKIKKFQITTP